MSVWLTCRDFYESGFVHKNSGGHQVCCMHCGDSEDGCEIEVQVTANARGVKPRVEGQVCCGFFDIRGFAFSRDDVARAVRYKRNQDRSG